MSIYPAAISCHRHPSNIAQSATPTEILSGPLTLKSIDVSLSRPTLGVVVSGQLISIFDGDDLVFRVCYAKSPDRGYAGLDPRQVVDFPLSGLRIEGSLGVSLEMVNSADAGSVGVELYNVSVLYQR